jgi:hypothetical protein
MERDDLLLRGAPKALDTSSLVPLPSSPSILVRLSSQVFFPTRARKNELLRPTRLHHDSVLRLPLPRGADTTVAELRESLLAALGAGAHELLQSASSLNNDAAHPLEPFVATSGDPGAPRVTSGALAPALGRTRGGELRCAVAVIWLPSPAQWREWRLELYAAERKHKGGGGCCSGSGPAFAGDTSALCGPQIVVVAAFLLAAAALYCVWATCVCIWEKHAEAGELEPPQQFFGHLDEEGRARGGDLQAAAV